MQGFLVAYQEPGRGSLQQFKAQQIAIVDPANDICRLIGGHFTGDVAISHAWIKSIEPIGQVGAGGTAHQLAQGALQNVPAIGESTKEFADMVKMIEDAARQIIDHMHPVLALKVYMQLNAMGHRMHSASFTFAHEVRKLLRKKKEA